MNRKWNKARSWLFKRKLLRGGGVVA